MDSVRLNQPCHMFVLGIKRGISYHQPIEMLLSEAELLILLSREPQADIIRNEIKCSQMYSAGTGLLLGGK